MSVYLLAKFEVSSMILTSFRHRGNFTLPLPPTSKRTPKKPTQIRVKVTPDISLQSKPKCEKDSITANIVLS